MSAFQFPIVPKAVFEQIVAGHQQFFGPDQRVNTISSKMLLCETHYDYDGSQMALSLRNKKEYEARALSGVVTPIQSLTGLDVPITDKQHKTVLKAIEKATTAHPNCATNIYAIASDQAKTIISAMAATEVHMLYCKPFHCTIIEFVNRHSYDDLLVWSFRTQNNSFNKIKKEDKK